MERVEKFKTDLQKPINVQELKSSLFLHDNTGNKIIVEVTDDGAVYAITGTVRAYMIRSDGTTVIFDGTSEGNIATIVMPKEVYYYTGRANFLIRVEEEGNSVTLCAFTAIVNRDRTDRISDDEHIIPSIDEIIAIVDRIYYMTARATTLPAGSTPTVVMSLIDGHYDLLFGIPQASVDVIDDNAGSGDYNKTWSADKLVNTFDGKADASGVVDIVASAGSWTSATPPTQTISATGVTASNNIIVSPSSSITAEQLDALAAAKIICTAQGAGTITLTCYGEEPSVNIPLLVMIMG